MNWPLYRSLHERGLTQTKLSALTGINRSVLARILTNEPGRGKETLDKLAPHLTLEEWRILGWPDQIYFRNCPPMMEQSSTGSNVPNAPTR